MICILLSLSKRMVAVISGRTVALGATVLHILGLLICAFTLPSDWLWPALGFGVLVGSGVGFNLTNNIIVAKKCFPHAVTLVFGKEKGKYRFV